MTAQAWTGGLTSPKANSYAVEKNLCDKHLSQNYDILTRNLSIWMHVPFSKKKDKLLFGKIGIEMAEWDHVKS